MPATSSRDRSSANERTSLVENEITDSNPSFAKDSLRRRSSTLLNEATKAERFRAIRICYFGMFVSSIVFSITVASLWPFLQIVDKTAEATFLGWLVASFSLGQLIASPLIGYIANRTDKNKSPLVVSTALIVISNVHYAYVESFDNFLVSNKWWLMLSRFIMGIGAANSTIMRSYASSATTMAERTNVMANLSAYQGIGFILGPLIQALFAFIGYPGLVHSSWLHLNIYTAPAFFSAITAAINVFLFLGPFKDVRVVTSPRRSINKGPQKPTSVSSDDRQQESMAIICCLYLFFIAYLTFTNYETIASPLSIDMYAWTKEESTRNNGYLLGGLGFMSVAVLIVTKILAKRFQDRLLMLGGMIICFLGYFVFLPWGDDYPSVQIATLPTGPTTVPTVTMIMSNTTTPVPDNDDKGCPLDYDWCYNVPRVQLPQYIMASIIITIGFTVGNVICYSIFSKKLGDRPQGTMMGIFTSAGSLARAFGPITVGFLYKHWGPRAMMIFMLVFVATAIAAILFNYKRLYIEPEEPDDGDDSDTEDNPVVNS